MKTSLLRVLALTGLMTTMPRIARGDDIRAAFDRVSASVVMVLAEEAGFSSNTSTAAARTIRGMGVYIEGAQRVTTSAELVQAADWVEVVFVGEKTVAARIQSSTALSDAAILELETPPSTVTGALFGDSDTVKPGDPIFMVTLAPTPERRMEAGTIVGLRAAATVNADTVPTDFFVIDIPVSAPDSGAPVFNAKGEVIGIVSHTRAAVGATGRGAVVPVNVVRGLAKESSFWTGVSGRLVSGELARALRLPQKKGFLVERVAHNSAADRFGLRGGTRSKVLVGQTLLIGGDIVLAVDGIAFSQDDSLNKISKHLRERHSDEVVHIDVLRSGRPLRLSAAFEF